MCFDSKIKKIKKKFMEISISLVNKVSITVDTDEDLDDRLNEDEWLLADYQ